MYTLDTCIDIQPVCAFIGSFKALIFWTIGLTKLTNR